MSSRLKLAGICFAAAFGLAACGGGGGGTATMPDPTPTPKPPAAPTAESLKADAADAITDAAAASMAAAQARKDAIKYAGMLTAQKVNGDSAMAIANAQKVLDAEMAANDAVMAADEALQAAMTAKTQAEALSEDDAGRAGAIAAAERAIKEATAQKRAAMAIVDAAEDATNGAVIDSLRGAVAMVEGSDPAATGYPKMPAAAGKAVAMSVKTALGTITGGDLTGTVPTNATVMNDGMAISAMSWAMIVGEDNVMSQRISTGNGITGLTTVMATAFAGMEVSKVFTGTAPTLPAAGTMATFGAELDQPASHMGIPGRVFCGGKDCATADGELTGSWYFRPDSPTALYVANPQMPGMYMAATMYARYGYWLTFDATTGAANGITTAAATGANTAGLSLLRPTAATADVTAEYSGKAAGISVRGDASGHFTADVNLTATFGEAIADSNISGHVSGFEGNAVNSSWRVTLSEADLADTGAATGTTAGGGTTGAWSAQGYGTAAMRPTGFFGTFNANFSDGAAAGAYATRKME